MNDERIDHISVITSNMVAFSWFSSRAELFLKKRSVGPRYLLIISWSYDSDEFDGNPWIKKLVEKMLVSGVQVRLLSERFKLVNGNLRSVLFGSLPRWVDTYETGDSRYLTHKKFPSCSHHRLVLFRSHEVYEAMIGSEDLRTYMPIPYRMRNGDFAFDLWMKVAGPTTAKLEAIFWNLWNVNEKDQHGNKSCDVISPMRQSPLIQNADATSQKQDDCGENKMCRDNVCLSDKISIIRTDVLLQMGGNRRFELLQNIIRDINSATKSILFCDQYFIFNSNSEIARASRLVLSAISRAIRRGVRVFGLVPERQVEMLAALNSSVHHLRSRSIDWIRRISKIDGCSPENLLILGAECRYVHAKLIVIDDRLTLIGSANLHPRSFLVDDELNLRVDDSSFAKGVLKDVLRELVDDRSKDCSSSSELVMQLLSHPGFAQYRQREALGFARTFFDRVVLGVGPDCNLHGISK
jgi:phosphatidylserine/phosphatidylglycerophosphate/cardiolipin synthase-like enzyme